MRGSLIERPSKNVLELPDLVSRSRAGVAVVQLDPQFSADEFVERVAVK
jgi:hypothetical protein